ncbi:MAG: aspartate aminotransferase family protein [Faecalibacterium sp.]
MKSKKVIARDQDYVLGTYGRAPLVIEEGLGMVAQSPEGQDYLDFTSGIGVNCLGFCDPDWSFAVAEQAGKLQHISNLYYTNPCTKLAKKLCTRTGMSKVFFGNSGAEANEGALKAARKYSFDKYGAGRNKIISLENSFHGRTMATLTATGQDSFHNFFGPFNQGFAYAPANDFEAFKKKAAKNVCAVIIELVQGEGGVCALDKDYVAQLAEYCHQKDILIIVDEVQTGIGRTGTFLACEQYGLQPDILSLAKGLGGGLPIGAFLVSEAVAPAMGAGTHGSTYGANPICCAGANVVMDKLDDDFLENVQRMSVILRAQVAKLPHVKEVSGLGLMVGIEFEEGIAAGEILAKCREHGLLVLTAKTRLRLLPPLIVSEAEIDTAIAILQDILSAI